MNKEIMTRYKNTNYWYWIENENNTLCIIDTENNKIYPTTIIINDEKEILKAVKLAIKLIK